jgi:hypothetical protein
MSWSLFARIGRGFARLRPRRAPHPAVEIAPLEIAPEFTTEELADFLEGDAYPNDARPEFREQLREELWQLVQQTHGGKRSE